MVLLMHAEVEKDDSKDTFECDDDAHKADMGPESQVLRWKQVFTDNKDDDAILKILLAMKGRRLVFST